jgi:hypothetical protein
MEMSPPCKAISRWATQEFSNILRNPNTNFRVKQKPAIGPYPEPDYTTPPYCYTTIFNIIFLLNVYVL